MANVIEAEIIKENDLRIDLPPEGTITDFKLDEEYFEAKEYLIEDESKDNINETEEEVQIVEVKSNFK